MNIYLSNGDCLRFPTPAKEIQKGIARLDTGQLSIYATDSPARNLAKYIQCADLGSVEDIQKLNAIVERTDAMTQTEHKIFSGALDSESVNGLDDVLRIADSLAQYELIPEVTTDRELGGWLVENDMLGVSFPQAVRPYLDYVAIGAAYYSDHGGAYTLGGYVRRRDTEPELDTDRKTVFTAHLQAGARQCVLKLPASDKGLDAARRQLRVDDFCEMELTELECAIPYLDGMLPQDCISVADADKLALEIEGMEQTDGELMKYLSALCAEEPSTFQEALEIACNIDDYERITEGTYEYGQTVLRRIGADDEIIDTIDGYMDFEQLGRDAMQEDGVRRTEYGLIRRLSEPFPTQGHGQIFQ